MELADITQLSKPKTMRSELLSALMINAPTGKPLYTLSVNPEIQSGMKCYLREKFHNRQFGIIDPAIFVLWASECIFQNYQGGPLSWEIIFRELEFTADHQKTAELTEAGLKFWKREVKKSRLGHRHFLYTLMSERGVPKALLQNERSNFFNLVSGALAYAEKSGNVDLEPFIATHSTRLPRVYHNDDFYALIQELVSSLREIRQSLPNELPPEAVLSWLKTNKPNWKSEIPICANISDLEALIKPLLSQPRELQLSSCPIFSRQLVWNDQKNEWRSVILISSSGELPSKALNFNPGNPRFRLIPNTDSAEELADVVFSGYIQASNNNSSETALLQRAGNASEYEYRKFPLNQGLIAEAYTDGNHLGSIQLLSAMPLPSEGITFWHQSHRDPNLAPCHTGRTSNEFIWALVCNNSDIVPGQGTSIEGGPIRCEYGSLWKLKGRGDIVVDGRNYLVSTNSTAPNYNITYVGKTLPNFKEASSREHVYVAFPDIYLQDDAGIIIRIPTYKRDPRLELKISNKSNRVNFKWFNSNMTELIARGSFAYLNKNADLSLFEDKYTPSELGLQVKELPPGTHIALKAGQYSTTHNVASQSDTLKLKVNGIPPTSVEVSVTLPDRKFPIRLTTSWPWRSGYFISPDGRRLLRDEQVSVFSLARWSVVAPADQHCELEINGMGNRRFRLAIPIIKNAPLYTYQSLIRFMLSYLGPDGEVRVFVNTNGKSSASLHVRHYEEVASVIENRCLRLGSTDKSAKSDDNVFSQLLCKGRANLLLVDIEHPDQASIEKTIECSGDIDLPGMVPNSHGTWMIQGKLNGKYQRPVVWSNYKKITGTRDSRIKDYIPAWQSTLHSNRKSNWLDKWNIIKPFVSHHDAGALDQVQALASVPEALVRLLFIVPKDDVGAVFDLNLCIPVFWSLIKHDIYAKAMQDQYIFDKQFLASCVQDEELEAICVEKILNRIQLIKTYHPELVIFFAHALAKLKAPPALFADYYTKPDQNNLIFLANSMAIRMDHIPAGLRLSVRPQKLPLRWPNFTGHVQSIALAPLLAAEIACGIQDIRDTTVHFEILNARLLDPNYFDSAYPIAVSLLLS